MSELVAVEGMTLLPDDPTVLATISIVSPASLKVKSGGNGVYKDQTNISVTNITVPSAGATIPDPGPYNVPLNAEAVKVKTEGDLVLREKDLSDIINAVPKIPGSPPVDYPVSFKIEITVANQIKVKAE